MMQLEKSAGPSCPHCGCNECELQHAGVRFGRPFAKFHCQYCDREFCLGVQVAPKDGIANGVIYRPVRCPICKSKNTEITKGPSGGRTRRHKCRDCGEPFKSTEE